MTALEALVAAALALAWLALEPRLPERALWLGQAPDLLLALAVGLARAPRERRDGAALGAALALGALRDAASGSTRGIHALGYALAAWLASGRRGERDLGGLRPEARRGAHAPLLRGVLVAAALVPLAHLPAAIALGLGGAGVAGLARALGGLALATACGAPAVLVPLAAACHLARGPSPRGFP